MYAIFQDRGRQYKVTQGDVIDIDLREEEADTEIVFDEVLLLNDGEKTQLGAPFVDKVSVTAKVKGLKKGKKIVVIKFKRRKGYKKKQGHRQKYTSVEILSIQSK